MNERQNQILRAAVSLFVSEGVGVSTANVAKAAGVSNGTLFNCFPTKQDLIDAMFVTAKASMFDALQHHGDDAFNRVHVRKNWDDYLDWARRNPLQRQVMHLLLESGLVSEAAQAEIDRVSEPHLASIESALAKGAIRGPSVDYVKALIFFQLDLVLTLDLRGEDEALAFDMLCHSIGLSQ